MGNTKPQSNSSDKISNHKFKDIEEAIQKAIDTESLRKDSIEKAFKNYKSK